MSQHGLRPATAPAPSLTSDGVHKRYRPVAPPVSRHEPSVIPSDDYDNPAPVAVGPARPRRSMVSPLVATYVDSDQNFTSDHDGEAPGRAVVYSQPSGAARTYAMSAHVALLGGHETRARRSRKGRSTFDVLRRGRVSRVVTSARDDDGSWSGLAGMDGISLARLADRFLAAHEGTRVVSPMGHETYGSDDMTGERSAAYLLGTSVRTFEQVIHAGHGASDAFRVAERHEDLYGALARFAGTSAASYSRRTAVMRRDRDVTGHVPVRYRPAVRSASWGESVTTHAERRTGETKLRQPTRSRIRGKFVRGERRRLRVTLIVGARGGLAGWSDQYATRDGRLISWHPDPRKVWVGHRLVKRPAPDRTARDRVPTARQLADKHATPDPLRDRLAVRISAGETSIALSHGTLTVRTQSQGRYALTFTPRTGAPMSWRARSARAAAARVPTG